MVELQVRRYRCYCLCTVPLTRSWNTNRPEAASKLLAMCCGLGKQDGNVDMVAALLGAGVVTQVPTLVDARGVLVSPAPLLELVVARTCVVARQARGCVGINPHNAHHTEPLSQQQRRHVVEAWLQHRPEDFAARGGGVKGSRLGAGKPPLLHSLLSQPPPGVTGKLVCMAVCVCVSVCS